MVMWNLVGHGVMWAARGLEAFSRTEAGKKTVELSAKALEAAKKSSNENLASFRHTRAERWAEGATVVAADGRVGIVVRYLTVAEAGGPVNNSSSTTLVLLDLIQYTSELDRYLIASENSLRGI
jgi:hypothetical protein